MCNNACQLHKFDEVLKRSGIEHVYRKFVAEKITNRVKAFHIIAFIVSWRRSRRRNAPQPRCVTCNLSTSQFLIKEYNIIHALNLIYCACIYVPSWAGADWGRKHALWGVAPLSISVVVNRVCHSIFNYNCSSFQCRIVFELWFKKYVARNNVRVIGKTLWTKISCIDTWKLIS